jgi:hypothetical protein
MSSTFQSIRLTFIMSVFVTLGLVQQKSAFAADCPCDIYKKGGTPCYAAHSTVRALVSTYNGPLYQIRRKSDNKTMDIGLLAPGGYANTAQQDSFSTGTKCDLTAVYDQSGNGNNLWYQGSTMLPASSSSSFPSRADTETLFVGGHKVHSVFIIPGNCYWWNAVKSGAPTGSQPEGFYMVTSGTHYNNQCCFDYGNSETDRTADGEGAMDALNFSTITAWGTGAGSGPWVMADLEYGIFAQNTTSKNQNDLSQTSKYVTAILKNDGTKQFALKGANATTGSLTTFYNGILPGGKWTPMKKQGAIILGCGGDCCKSTGGANASAGTFYEGAMVVGYPTDSTENLIQANIVSAGYGSTVLVGVSKTSGYIPQTFSAKVRYLPSNAGVVIGYTLQDARNVSVNIFDERGKRIAAVADGFFSAGWHEAVWDAARAPGGVYVCRMAIDGREEWTGKIVVGK